MYKRRIYLKDVTLYGNTYYANYFDFCGEAREALLFEVCGGDLNKLGGIEIVTTHASLDFKAPTYPNDEIEIEIAVEKYTGKKLYVEFSIYCRREKIAIGSQAFSFLLDRSPVPIPLWFIERLIKLT